MVHGCGMREKPTMESLAYNLLLHLAYIYQHPGISSSHRNPVHLRYLYASQTQKLLCLIQYYIRPSAPLHTTIECRSGQNDRLLQNTHRKDKEVYKGLTTDMFPKTAAGALALDCLIPATLLSRQPRLHVYERRLDVWDAVLGRPQNSIGRKAALSEVSGQESPVILPLSAVPDIPPSSAL